MNAEYINQNDPLQGLRTKKAGVKGVFMQDNRHSTAVQLNMIKAIKGPSRTIQRIPIYRVEQDEGHYPSLKVNSDKNIEHINPGRRLNVSVGYPDHVPDFGQATQELITFDLNDTFWKQSLFPMIKNQKAKGGQDNDNITFNDPKKLGFKIEIPYSLINNFISNITPGSAQSMRKSEFVSSLKLKNRAEKILAMVSRTIEALPNSGITKKGKTVKEEKETLKDHYDKEYDRFSKIKETDLNADYEYNDIIENLWDQYNKTIVKILNRTDTKFDNKTKVDIASAFIPT